MCIWYVLAVGLFTATFYLSTLHHMSKFGVPFKHGGWKVLIMTAL